MTTYSLTCKNCGQPFEAGHPRITYCSASCKQSLQRAAKAAKAEYDRKRYDANPEAVKQRAAAWREINRERVNERAREQWADPERKQVMQARIARYVQAHQDECRQRWHANTRRRIATGEHQALTAKRRDKMRTELSPLEVAKVAQFYRVAKLMTRRYGVEFEVDHIVPIAAGGKHHPSNLQVLRRDLNRKKGAKLVA